MATRKKPSEYPKDDPRIVIGKDRWIYVGWFALEGDWVVIYNARVIRRWGTQGDNAGLATLANRGPQSGTILEEPSTVRMHVLALGGSHDCNPEKWALSL